MATPVQKPEPVVLSIVSEPRRHAVIPLEYIYLVGSGKFETIKRITKWVDQLALFVPDTHQNLRVDKKGKVYSDAATYHSLAQLLRTKLMIVLTSIKNTYISLEKHLGDYNRIRNRSKSPLPELPLFRIEIGRAHV